MRAATNRKIMHEITKSMLPLISRRSVVDELRSFLIEANEDDGSITVTANNMESAMQRRFTASVESGGRFVMDARMLVNILAHLEGETVEFAASARTVDITGGTCTYTMNTLACDGFPRTAIPFPGSTMKVSGIRMLYSKTCSAVDSDTANVLSGIHLEIAPGSIKATGCDKKCIAISRSDRSCGGSMNVTLPRQSLGQLASAAGDDELEVGICGSNAVFMKEGLLFSARCIGAAYVDIGRILNSLSVAYEAKLECKDFKRRLVLRDLAELAVQPFDDIGCIYDFPNLSGISLTGKNGILQKKDALVGQLSKKHRGMIEYIGQVRNAADHGSDADEGGLTWLVTNETAIVFPILVAIIIKDIYDRNFNHDIKV